MISIGNRMAKAKAPHQTARGFRFFCFPLFAKRKPPIPITEKQKRKNTAKTSKNESPKEFLESAFYEILSAFHFSQNGVRTML